MFIPMLYGEEIPTRVIPGYLCKAKKKNPHEVILISSHDKKNSPVAGSQQWRLTFAEPPIGPVHSMHQELRFSVTNLEHDST